jgi:hypothetical protein
MIILKWIVEKCDGVVWTRLLWLRTGTREGFYEHGNKPSCSMKYWRIPEKLNDWRLLQKDSDPWSNVVLWRPTYNTGLGVCYCEWKSCSRALQLNFLFE